MSGDDQGIPDGVLSDKLLDEAVEHVPEEAHGGTAWDGAVMVAIEVKLRIDDSFDVWLVEISKDVWKNDGALVLPGLPSLVPLKRVKMSWGLM